MFIYARMDGKYCNDDVFGGCQCFCETQTTQDGKCQITHHGQWDLYTLVKEDRISKSGRNFSRVLVI